MDDKCIKRINELYHKQKKVGLTPEEKEEQQFLRKRYIESIKQSIRGQMEQVNIQNEDGSIVNAAEERDKKMKQQNQNDADAEHKQDDSEQSGEEESDKE